MCGGCGWLLSLILLCILILMWFFGYGPNSTACCSAEKTAPVALEDAALEEDKVVEQVSVTDEPQCTNVLQSPIIFPIGSMTADAETISRIVDASECFKGKDITLTGYADKASGNDVMNLEISRQRAETIKNILIREGLDVNKITAIGGGSTDKFSQSDPETNRRVVIEEN